jgi:hypothetical protein
MLVYYYVEAQSSCVAQLRALWSNEVRAAAVAANKDDVSAGTLSSAAGLDLKAPERSNAAAVAARRYVLLCTVEMGLLHSAAVAIEL